MIALKQVLVATDFGPAAEAALEHGRAFARRFGASLHLLHVAENLFFKPVMTDPLILKASLARRLDGQLTPEDRAGLFARAVVETSDDPADAIVSYAREWDIDLIVVGTHGREGMSRVLTGSVAEHVVRHAPCPVLTVKAPVAPVGVPLGSPAFAEARLS